MDLQDYLRILRKRWVSILAITALAVMGAGAATLLMTPKYQATAQTFVSVRDITSTSDLLQGSNFSQNQVTSYAQLVTSPLVLSPVIAQLRLDMTPADLAKQVTADAPLNTVLINITATSTSPEQAAAIANAAAASFGQVIPGLEQASTNGSSPVKISTVQEATPPLAPSSPKKSLNLALGLLVGLALGIGFAVARETLDTKVHGVLDVARVTDVPVLGAVPYDPGTPEHPLAAIGSGRGEALRRLRTNLQFATLDGKARSIVVTSAVPGEGKTTTAINLGLTLAQANLRVIVVDADLRRPNIAAYLGLEGSVGLTTVLLGRATLDQVVQRYGPTSLHVLPAGQVPPNPSEVLGSAAMADLIAKLTASYDIVLLDSPPLLPVTDAAVLSRQVNGTLVVAGAGRLRRQQLADALESLLTIDAHVLGVVINRMPTKGRNAYGYSYYGTYQPRPEDIASAVAAAAPNGKPAQPPVQPAVIGMPPQRFLPPPAPAPSAAAAVLAAPSVDLTRTSGNPANGQSAGVGASANGTNGHTPASGATPVTGHAPVTTSPNGSPANGSTPAPAGGADEILPLKRVSRHRR